MRDNNLMYTLGDEGLDRLLSLDQNRAAFTPSKDAIESLAAVNYLYGLFGYSTTNYTAIPAGYLTTLSSEDDYVTLLVSGDKRAYYREHLVQLAETQIKNASSEEEYQFWNIVKTLLNTKNISLVKVCYQINSFLVVAQGLESVKNNVKNAIYPFSGDKNSLNSQNCSYNRVALEEICLDALGYDEYSTPEQKEEAKGLMSSVLQEFILPGYLAYVGHDRQGNPIKRDNQIVNRPYRIQDIFKRLKNIKGSTMVLNACSTDYTADVVYSLLKSISECENVREGYDDIDRIVPHTPHNEKQRHEASKLLRNLGGRHM